METITKIEMTADEMYCQEEWAKIMELENEEYQRITENKERYRNELKHLISTRKLWSWLDENESWEPVGIFDVKIEWKRNGYYNRDMPHGRIEGLPTGEMHHQKESKMETGAKHVFLVQYCHFEDCYSGYIAIPLKNYKYFLIKYAC